jgi:alpha-ketoglutarate-dependent taurine dioxygenase
MKIGRDEHALALRSLHEDSDRTENSPLGQILRSVQTTSQEGTNGSLPKSALGGPARSTARPGNGEETPMTGSLTRYVNLLKALGQLERVELRHETVLDRGFWTLVGFLLGLLWAWMVK